MVHDRDAVAELIGLLHVVGREQDRLALAVELAEDPPQREAALGIEAGGGSSRNSTAGRWKIARAIINRCAIPPESAYTEASAHLERCSFSSSSSAMRRDSAAEIPNRRP